MEKDKIREIAKEVCERNGEAMKKMTDNIIQFPNAKTARCFDCDVEFELEDEDDILCPECSDDYL
jgi:Zn finger protein HypA/HybF involved in hydrogenase expression